MENPSTSADRADIAKRLMNCASLTRKIELANQLASSLIFGSKTQNYTPPGPKTSTRSQEEEAALLLLICLEDLGVGANHRDRAAEVVRLLGHVLLLNDKPEAYANTVAFSHPQVAAGSQQIFQRGAALLSAGHLHQAVCTLEWADKQQAGNALGTLLTVKGLVCQPFPTSQEVIKAVALAEQALASLGEPYEFLRPRVLHARGTALGAAARAAPNPKDRAGLQARAEMSLREAADLEPSDALIGYELALQLAEMGKVVEALPISRDACLRSGGAHSASWQLLALLLSVQPGAEQLEACESAKSVCLAATRALPEGLPQVPVLLLQAKLEVAMGDLTAACDSLQKALECVPVQQVTKVLNYTGDALGGTGDAAGCAADTSRVKLPSVCESSPVASLVHCEILQDLAELYALWKMPEDAHFCAEKAALIMPAAPGPIFCKGLAYEAEVAGTDVYSKDALEAYEDALALDPSHHRSRVRIAAMTCLPESSKASKDASSGTGHTLSLDAGAASRVAYALVGDALRSNPNSVEAWLSMASLHEKGVELQEATTCLETALQLELQKQVIPFSDLPRML
ncbi:hypothetical protein CYMTET_25957 [Cymbomonas tetramitiformis]|uniref:Uncharacterized protein n=1 Tax=Cymbomonas tetramitiformis TaxID=36881 RepID=A0AAE0FTH5_9CHLO|nr:hypothetical protein CYMTET_25957 [Cymbomonas tetramitiformis]